MTDEILNEGAEASSNDDLRSIISRAVEDQKGVTGESTSSTLNTSNTNTALDEGTAADRARDDKGRFAAKADQQAAATQQNGQTEQQAETAGAAQQQAEAPQAGGPPPGWSVQAKAHFNNLPPEVQQAIAKREAEVNEGFKKYAGLDQYVKSAQSYNRTLPQVLEEVTQIDNAFIKNPMAGLQMIMQRYNLNPVQVAQSILGGRQAAPQQQQQQQQSVGVPDISRAVQAELERQSLNKQIEDFKSNPTNIYFDNVRDKMAALLNTGLADTLQDAYDKACQLHPEIAPLLKQAASPAATQTAQAATIAAQAKAAAKAVKGAPMGGTPPAPAAPQDADLRETIARAVAARKAGRA